MRRWDGMVHTCLCIKGLFSLDIQIFPLFGQLWWGDSALKCRFHVVLFFFGEWGKINYSQTQPKWWPTYSISSRQKEQALSGSYAFPFVPHSKVRVKGRSLIGAEPLLMCPAPAHTPETCSRQSNQWLAGAEPSLQCLVGAEPGPNHETK